MKFSLPFVLLLLSHVALGQSSLSTVAERLDKAGCFRAGVTYEVLLPNADTPVSYNVDLMSYTLASDTLAPAQYLTEWTPTDSAANAASGFSAYYTGNYFRYRNGKLQENHVSDNLMPFAPRGTAESGLQQQDQFAGLLPAFLADKFRKMSADSTYKYEITEQGGSTIIKGEVVDRGFVMSEFEYRLSQATGMPESMEIITNPGQMAEQLITAKYNTISTHGCEELSEPMLISRHSDIFDKYRKDSFALENLRGEPLPSFTAAKLRGGRFSRERGDAMGEPTVLAVLGMSVDATDKVIADLREAVNHLPFAVRLMLAFTDNNRDIIEEYVGNATPGEEVLVSARALARDCGVTDSPSIIFVRADGTVADIHVGRNNDLRDIVIQKAAMTR